MGVQPICEQTLQFN